MSDTLTKKLLALTITLGAGSFGDEVGDTVTLTGFRMSALCQNNGGDSMGMCQLRVFGLAEAMMNKLTTIGQINKSIRIKTAILLAAGDDDNGMQSVFQGTIMDAWADYNSAPDVAFNVLAYSGLGAAVKPVGATSYKGSVAVVDIMRTFASEMGLVFEDGGVDVKLASPYFPGTTLSKVRACAMAANCCWIIDRGVLAIWPRDGARSGVVPLVSPDTGMVGYPSLSSKGMTVKMLFNWNIRGGGPVAIKSSIPMANGTWTVGRVEHDLSSETPDGPWFTNMDCSNVRP